MWHFKTAGFMDKLAQPGRCRKKRRVSTISALLAALLLGAPAYAAEIDWYDYPGHDSVKVNSGDTVTLRGSWFSLNSITVAEDGMLVIPEETNVQFHNIPEAKLENAGTIRVGGSLSLGSYSNSTSPESTNFDIKNFSNTGVIDCFIPTAADPEHDVSNLSIPSAIFNKFMEDGGKIIVKGSAQDSCRFVIPSGDKAYNFSLSASEFATPDSEEGRIILGEYSSILFGSNPLEITGNDLNIGPTKYAEVHNTDEKYDVTDSEISRVRGRHLTLTPDNPEKTITLHSGIIQPGAGRAPGSTQMAEPSDLTINGTLQLDGGALVLGSGGNQLGEGTVSGNVIIGTNKTVATPDSAMIGKAGHWTMNGDLTLNKSGYLYIGKPFLDDAGNPYLDEEGEPVKSSLTLNGDLFLNGANLNLTEQSFNMTEGHTANLSANTILNILSGSIMSFEDTTVGSENTVINVTGGAILTAPNTLHANSAQINFDPPFIADGDTSNASMGGLSFDSDNVDARMNIGRNSMVTLGSTDYEWLRGQIGDYQTKNNLLWGRDITAALAVRTPQTLASNGGINVDGTWVSGGNPAAVNVARFADKSLFVVDAAGVGKNAALSGNGTGTLRVESGAKLLIAGGADGDDIVVTDEFANSTISDDGWSQNLATTTDLLDIAGLETRTGKYVVHLGKGAPVQEFMPDVSPELATIVETAVTTGLDVNSANAGVRFVSRAVDNRYIGANDATLAAASIESAARMAVIGAAPQMTLAANNAAGAAITQRTGLAQPDGMVQAVDANGNLIDNNAVHANSFALWIMPLYQSTNGFGMEAGNLDYDFNGALGGVALGADYTFANAIRAGISFNIGGGYAQGSGDMNKTTNNMNFWGVGAYAGWTKNNFGLAADVNFTSTYNKLKQELPQAMMMEDLKSDVTAWAISTGLRAEYKFETAALDITPHVGFRFINLNTDSYDINSGGTVVEGDSFSQNIWTFPIGVSLSKSIEMQNGWHVKPLLDVNVTPATGDIKAKTNIRFTGINQEAEIDTKMMDYVTYGGTAGIEFGNDTISFGVNYNGQFGAESSAHGVFGTFRYEF